MLGGMMRWAAFVVMAALALPAMAFAAGFDDPASRDPGQQLDTAPLLPYPNVQRDDTPNDPDYDQTERGLSDNVFEQRSDLFGFAPESTRDDARYTQGSAAGKGMVSGFNAAGAWKLSRGDPDVTVAVLDTGINWDNAGLRTKVRLNASELPTPQLANGSAAPADDVNGNGFLDVDDFKDDVRVGTPAPTGKDLIDAFSNRDDADGNGYVDDIAGWDFFDDDNDPADASSYFAAENHGTGRAEEAAERGDDGDGSIGVCPKCTFVPMRVWDTFVSDQNNFFLAVTYAADNGVEVIVGADGGLYHSRFTEAASKYAYDKGVVQVYSGDDLNTGNHNYPAAYDHTMLIQGVAADVEGLGTEVPGGGGDDPTGVRDGILDLVRPLGFGSQAPVKTYFRNANTTQFGGKSSISMTGPTGSANTGKAGGAAALVIAAAKAKGVDLTPDETRALLEQTAEDVLPANTAGLGVPDPAQPGFDTHFGYGRANLGEAVREADEKRVPPQASIGSPQWYAPLAGGADVTGRASARGEGFTWKLEWGVGLAPTDDEWQPVDDGESDGAAVTGFGALPMNQIRAALRTRTLASRRDCADTGGPTLDCAASDPYEGQFAVRLTVTGPDGATKKGVDRKVFTALEDDTLREGFPKKLGAGGEAPLRYADLNADNVQELVLPTEDGLVHAYRPDGSELPGWPVRTELQFAARAHQDAPALKTLPPPLEPPRAPTIADLTGDGRPEVITAAGERIYAWKADGSLLEGWPVRPDPGRVNCRPQEQEKEISHPKCGFLASPAIARLDGKDAPASVVVPGLDGRLRAYEPDGSQRSGFPVRLQDTREAEPMTAESINNPAIGDLDGDGKDDIVAATNEVYGGADSEGGDVGFGGLLAAAGSTSRVYAVDGAGNLLAGWPVKPGGIIQNVLPLIGPGHDPALVKVGGQPRVVVSVTGGALSLYKADGTLDKDMQQNAGGGGSLNLFESAAVGNLDGTGPAVVKYQVDLQQAANLLLVGQNFPYSHRIGAFNAATGVPKPGFPVITDDYQFLSSSTVANVAGGANPQVLAGTGLGLLHAYDGVTGRDTAGFPKVTGGWLFAPAAVSDDGRVAAITREGFLFEWDAEDAAPCQSEWPSFRHDQQGSGNYDADGTPPGAPDAMALEPLGGDRFRLRFRSPGDDALCGTAQDYEAEVDGTALDLGAPVAGGSTFTREISLPAGARRVTVRAVDEADNSGAPGVLERQPAGAGGGGDGGGGGGSGGGGFVPATQPGAVKRPAKPRLTVTLKYRKGRTAGKPRRTCARSSIRVTVGGADRGQVRRANLRLGRRIQADRKAPASKVFGIRRLRKTHLRRGRAEVRLKDGRLMRISSGRVRICARQSRR